MDIDCTLSDINIKDLKLLSINETRKVLGIRHEAVKKLIAQGKLQALSIHKRIKIPAWSLVEYQKVAVQEFSNKIINYATGNEIQVIQRILNKNLT